MHSPIAKGRVTVADPAQVLLPLHPRMTPPEFALLNALGLMSVPPSPVFPLLLTQLENRTPLTDEEAGHVENVVRHCESQFMPSQEVTGAKPTSAAVQEAPTQQEQLQEVPAG
jgi:hypothetical protein